MATNTSRVSPTLCHILRAGGWTRAQRLVAGRLGDMGGGCPRAAPPGGGTGRCGGGRGGVGPQTRPPTPDRGDRVAGRAGGRRGATTASSLRGAGATACRGRGERTRCHGGHRRERRECGGGAAAARPWLRLLRGPLGPQRRQMSTTPRGRRRRRCSSTPPQQLHQAPTPQRLRRCAGLAGKWSAKLLHAAGLCPTRNYNSQASTLLKVSPRSPLRSPFPVPCAFGILESPPLKTAG